MSALPPKADIQSSGADARFVPIATLWRAVIAAKPSLITCAACRKLLSRNRNLAVTESLQLNGSSITCRVGYEFEMAGAAKFFGLVKSPSMVVVSVTARERSEHRRLVLAVPLYSRNAR
jgi:hypothetical protein